jgi:hypothetical protein
MCGATQEQKNLESQQAAFYGQMTSQYQQVFGKQQAILDTLTGMFKPILSAGPSQRGFSDAEHTALESSATETTAHNYADAQRTLNERLATLGGGDDFIPSGEEAQLREGLLATEAADRSSLQNQIEQADFSQGHQNWQQAADVLGGVAAQDNPAAFANATTSAGSAAGTTANQIAEASNSIWGSVIGGVSGIAGAAVKGWAPNKGGG